MAKTAPVEPHTASAGGGTAERHIGIWPSLPPDLRLRGSPLPFPLADGRCRLYRRSRQALFAGVRAHGLGPGDVVLVPAYHHGSEVEALVRAGVTCRFYDVTPACEPDAATLDAMLQGNVRALYLIDYFGFPQHADRWRRWCDERGLLLVQDASQAWLSSRNGTPAGALADIAVYCLYKKYALPGGAALISTRPAEPTPPGSSDLVPLARACAGWLRDQLRTSARHDFAPSEPFDAARDFALGDPEDAPGRATRRLLAHFATDVATRRSRNAQVLVSALRDLVPPPFRSCSDDVAPFVLPVATDAKAATGAYLESRGVAALNIWNVPHPSLPADGFPVAARLRGTLLGLPVHQHLRPADLERIAALTREAASSTEHASAEQRWW